MPSASDASSAPPNLRWKRFSFIGFTMIIVVIPFCLYYLFFVTSQSTYFSKRNFRVLAEIGDHISSKIDNLAANLVNVSERAKQVKFDTTKVEGKDKSTIKKVGGKESAKPVANAQKVDAQKVKVKEASDLVPAFKAAPVQYEPVQKTRTERELKVKPAVRVSNGTTASSNRNASPPTANANAGSPGTATRRRRSATAAAATGSAPPVTLDVEPDGGSFWLYLDYRNASGALFGNFSVKKDLNPLFEPSVARYVIDEQDDTQERLFDEVLVAEQETGRVIFERGPRGLNVVTLDSFLNNKGGKLELKLADQSSSLADVQIAGADYKLFLQPVRLTLSASTDENRQGVRWVVCGLTRTDHFRDETFAVSYTVLIVFMFAVLLAVLSWPLLKLKLMGPKDRLRRVDFGLTLFSALMGTALVTFILWDLHTYISLNDELDHNLEELSKTIEFNFKEELGNALEQLRQLNAEITTVPQKEQSAAMRELEDSKPKQLAENGATRSIPKKTTSPKAKSADSSTPSLSGRSDILTDYSKWETAPYPYFNNATWTDPTGKQRIKWTTRTETTNSVDVSKRQFFKDARDDKTWKLEHNGKVFEYSFELINSRNTGENVAVIATSVPDSPWVSNLDTRLMSLMGTVLPVGYGYAVIDSSGKVLFHSDEVKNLEEQFFAECENDRRLRSAVLARTNRLIETNYLGKGHRMYVSPLAGTPWTLVAFVDKRMVRTINLEVITLSIVLYLLFALSILALISFICLPRMIRVFSGRYLPTQGDGIRWLWPDRKRAGQYGLLILSYVLIACIFVLVLIVASGWFLAICCVVLPLLAAVPSLLILTKDPPARPVEGESGGSGSVPSYRTRYAIAFAGFLALVSVLPASGFFQIAHKFEMRLMVKHGQVSLARAIEERNERVTSQYESIKIGKQAEQANDRQGQVSLPDSKDRAAFFKRRLEPSSSGTNLDVYDSFFFGTTRVGVSQAQFVEETAGGVDEFLLSFRPLYNQSCVESQGLAAGASSDGLWRWKLDRKGHILLGKDKDGRNGEPSVALMSRIPAIVAPNTFLGWVRVILSIALVVLLPYGLVRFVARRFFLLDMDLPPCLALPRPTDLPHATDLVGNCVLLRSPITANLDELDRNKYFVTDLRSVNAWPEWTEGIRTEGLRSKPSSLPVVLQNFEHRMDDPLANREKLLAIEHLLKSERGVVVISTVDPLSFSLAPKPAGQAAANNGKVETVPSEPLAIEGKQNGAAGVNAQAPAPELSQTDVQARWTELFSNFATVCAADSSAEFGKAQPEFVSILKTKAPLRYIEEIGKRIGSGQNGTLRGKDDRDRAKVEELISEVVEQALPYHQALWMTCSEGQRCTLIQLAQDGMISPTNKHLRRLVKRGLIVHDPGLRLMDDSFRRFVKSVSRDYEVEAWRRQEGGSAWQLLRAPLLLILVGVALFLFITQKDVYDSTISFMSAVTAGIAALFRLLGMFNKDKGGSAVQS